MNFNIAAFTNKGTIRAINQDRILANGTLIEDGTLNLAQQSSCICFVADGVGGNKRGEFASQFVLESLKNEVFRDYDELTTRLSSINSELIEMAKNDESIEGTATTLTGLYIDSDNFYIFHAGDSELWYMRNNMFSKATTDQTADESINSPITSYFGGFEDNLTPEIGMSLDSSEDNDFYLLCSDGLFKSLSFEEIKSVLQDSISVTEKVNLLMECSISKGAPDNISVVLIHRCDDVSINYNQSEQVIHSENNATGIVSMNFSDTSTGVIGGKSSSDKTGIIGGGSEQTGVIGGEDSANLQSSLHGLSIGDTVELKQRKYQIKSIISEGTGEASVYLVTDDESNNLALKLYREFDNPKHEPNPEALARIKEINNPDILKLHDYGVGIDKYLGRFCFEICDYAEGGDLQRCNITTGLTIDFIEKQLVHEIFLGIKILHDNRIYHCDLKPGNIFFLDKEQKDLVIGDYGSAKTFEKDSEVDIQSTTTVKGTNVYMAPEQGRGHVSDKNDYYSLGMILLSMVYPDSLKSFREITIRQSKGIKIINYNEKYKRINNLIEGLTLNSFEHRFGKEEVEQWFKGEMPKVQYAGQNNKVLPVKIGNSKQIETGEDFVRLIESESQWYEKYIENVASWSQFLIWMNSYRDMEARSIFEGVRKHYESRGKEYLKEAFIRFFEPARVIRIDTSVFDFHNTEDLKVEVERFCSKLDEIWKFTDWKILRFYLFQFEFSLRQQALIENSITTKALSDKLLTSYGIQPKSFDDLKTEIHVQINDRKLNEFRKNLLEMFYCFNPNRGFRTKNNEEYKTLEEVVLYFVKEPRMFNDEYLSSEKVAFLEKIKQHQLSTLSYTEFVFEVFKNHTQTEIEFVSLNFDKYRDNVLEYKFFKSLNSFFETKNIHTNFTDRPERNLAYSGKRKLFQPFWTFSEDIINELSRKHNIVTLTEENKSQFKKSFLIRSLKRYTYIYSGQMLALAILIPSIYLLYMLMKDHISIDENWNFFRGSSQPAVVMDTFTIEVGIVYKELPLHAEAKGKSRNILDLNVSDTLRYLGKTQGTWEQVVFKNDTGWICPVFKSEERVVKRKIKKTKKHQP